MKTTYLLFLLVLIFSCSDQDISCATDLTTNGFTLEGLKAELKVIDPQLTTLEKFTTSGFTEIYRLIWKNGWVSSLCFTIGKQGTKYQLFIDGYAPKLKKEVRRVIELEPYEWDAITKELEKTDFWCSTHYAGNTERVALDGTWYYLEGIKNDRYHVIKWQFDKAREKLLTCILKAGNLGATEPFIRSTARKDSILYELSIKPFNNTEKVYLISGTDTLKNSEYGLLSIKIHKSDTLEIWNWRLQQFTSDGRVNEIPLVEMDLHTVW